MKSCRRMHDIGVLRGWTTSSYGLIVNLKYSAWVSVEVVCKIDQEYPSLVWNVSISMAESFYNLATFLYFSTPLYSHPKRDKMT